ncbi:Choline transporter-like protein 4 [Bagarius yarrelli]|uniref:Choline transporter-like protein n=1 Tax=Bagarius yarrelli TaxID=175774 RepID=A0A556V008_BAGYA|nr:Choline transporter-like protein 4 [Bagarius yarrelli]
MLCESNGHISHVGCSVSWSIWYSCYSFFNTADVGFLTIRAHNGIIKGVVKVSALSVLGIYQSNEEYQKHMNSQLKFGDLNSQSKFSDYLKVKEILLACLVILVLLEFILLMLFVSFVRRGLVTVMEMMGQCSNAIGVMLSTMAYPLITFLLVTLCVTFCTTFKETDHGTCPVRCVFSKYDDEDVFIQKYEQHLQAYNCLVSLWCLHFIIALGQCALARTFSTYYWTLSKPHNIGQSVLTKALFHTLGYHTGTMAFGAVFLTLFQGVRIVLEYLRDVSRGVLAYCFFSGVIAVPADTFQAESVVMVGAYFIAQGCFSLYSMAVDTFTFCVMDDLERNDGTLQRPYMSKSMMQILQKRQEPFNAAGVL